MLLRCGPAQSLPLSRDDYHPNHSHGLSLYSARAPHNSDFFGIPTSPHRGHYPKIHHIQNVGRRKCYQTAYKSSAVITPFHRFNSAPRGARPFRLSARIRRTTMWDSHFDNSKDPPGSPPARADEGLFLPDISNSSVSRDSIAKNHGQRTTQRSTGYR